MAGVATAIIKAIITKAIGVRNTTVTNFAVAVVDGPAYSSLN
jgi:hypothetical protein